jgi:hypothetical protein
LSNLYDKSAAKKRGVDTSTFFRHFVEYYKHKPIWDRAIDKRRSKPEQAMTPAEKTAVAPKKWDMSVIMEVHDEERPHTEGDFHKQVNEVRNFLNRTGLYRKYAIQASIDKKGNISVAVTMRYGPKMGKPIPESLATGKLYDAKKITKKALNWIKDQHGIIHKAKSIHATVLYTDKGLRLKSYGVDESGDDDGDRKYESRESILIR